MRFRIHKSQNPEATKAFVDAHRNLREVKARTPEVQRVASAVRETLRRNHFAEQLQSIVIRDVE